MKNGRFCFSFKLNLNRIHVHSLREHLASEMIEEGRLKTSSVLEETLPQSPRKRLNKNTVLSQQRPDVRDLVNSFFDSFFIGNNKFRLNKLEKVINIKSKVLIMNQEKFSIK